MYLLHELVVLLYSVALVPNFPVHVCALILCGQVMQN